MSHLKPSSLVAVPLPSGAYAVLWILEARAASLPRSRRARPYKDQAFFQFMVMEGFPRALPRANELARWKVAKDPAGEFPGRENVRKGCFFGDAPADFAVLGEHALPPEGHPHFASEGTMVFQNGEDCRAELFREWRRLHDRPALEAEWAEAAAERERRAEERRRTRSLPSMLRERAFASWAGTWPPRVVREARRIFRDATRELIALEEKGTKRQRTAVLKRIVRELNALDDKEGCIETVEREQLVARIEALASLVGVSNEGEALTGHRDW